MEYIHPKLKTEKSRDESFFKKKFAKIRANKINTQIKTIKLMLNSTKTQEKHKILDLRYSSKNRYNTHSTKKPRKIATNNSKTNINISESNNLLLSCDKKQYNILLLNDKIKINLINREIKRQKNIKEKKSKVIINTNHSIINLKEKIVERNKKIEETKNKIENYKKLNEELIKKIGEVNNQIFENRNRSRNNLEEMIIYLVGLGMEENEINYLLNMIINIRNHFGNELPNMENLTYEELLVLEEKIGNVSSGLSDEEIRKLPREKFIKYKYLEDKCIICQYDFRELETVVVLPCKHCYHFECIKPWIQSQNTCPFCKKSVRK